MTERSSFVPPDNLSNEVTLQLNVSPGDLGYLSVTLPALVRAHRGFVRETLVVVDCCRPERTRIVDADVRFPVAEFSGRVRELLRIVAGLRTEGWVDNVLLLEEGSLIVEQVLNKYMRGITSRTHDFGGSGLVSYFAAMDSVRTRYLLHYDVDVLLYQRNGYQWQDVAIGLMQADERVVAATPRISPPFVPEASSEDAPSRCERRPLQKTTGGWLNDWFSTRCFLLDLERFRTFMPLMARRLLIESLIRKVTLRGFPLSPEIMMFRAIGGRGGLRLNLSSHHAWFIHPTRKPATYLAALPRILEFISRGRCPEAQRGDTEVNLEAWLDLLDGQD